MKRKITLKEYGGKERKEIWEERGEKNEKENCKMKEVQLKPLCLPTLPARQTSPIHPFVIFSI